MLLLIRIDDRLITDLFTIRIALYSRQSEGSPLVNQRVSAALQSVFKVLNLEALAKPSSNDFTMKGMSFIKFERGSEVVLS